MYSAILSVTQCLLGSGVLELANSTDVMFAGTYLSSRLFILTGLFLLKLFAQYCLGRIDQETSTSSDHEDEEDSGEIYVILVAGCNNSCHGSEWMQKYMKVTGYQPELMAAEDDFVVATLAALAGLG